MDDLIKVNSDLLNDGELDTDATAVFRSYDIRGIYPEQLDAELAYQIAKAYLQIVSGKRFLIAHDMRESSNHLLKAMIQAITEEGCSVDILGETTTENLYFTVGKEGYDGGAIITASHNSAQFNGIKFVKAKSEPVDPKDLKKAFLELKDRVYYIPKQEEPEVKTVNNDEEFLNHVTSFCDGVEIADLKVVVDAGNGMAGDLVRKMFAKHPNLQLVEMYFEPHPDFPHHEANPSIAANLRDLQERVVKEKANLGVAFDGDGDRVFFVEPSGEVIEGYYIQALLTEYFLNKYKGEAVVYDIRNTKAIESIIRVTGGRGVISKAGHSNVKAKMRQEDAVFGGESSSSHFYYRDNFYADSGLITLQIILKLISETGHSIDELVQTYKDRFFISGEKNFYLKDPDQFAYLVQKLKNEYPDGASSDFDGLIIDMSNWRFSLRMSNTEPFMRLNIEADSRELLEEKMAGMFNIIEKFAQFTGEVSNLNSLKTMNLDKKEKLEFLYSNLHFTWNSFKGNYLDSLYGQEWSRNQPPIDVLRLIDTPVLDEFYEKNKINIEESIRLQQTYLRKPTWFAKLSQKDTLFSQLHEKPIAYFSLEFGIADWLQIYSGGLGVLAGDTVKEASDSGLPMVSVGIFYHQGYFYQRFTEDGWQLEDYLTQDIDDYPLETVKDRNGYTITVDVELGDKTIKVRGWRLKVGRRSLVLLDTNFSDNKDMEDRMITYHLYGGDQDTRIKQELVLGVGGYRLLKAAGIKPSILHLNEGHSAFAVIAQAQDIMQTEGLDFEEAIARSRENVLFTNHTLKQAGNDVFPYDLVNRYLEIYARNMGVDFRHIFSLGVDPVYAEGKFGMTILGLNNANKVNAVSDIHAVAAKKVWPDHEMTPVTNGVHMPTWVSEPIHRVLDECVSEHWQEQQAVVDWSKVNDIPDEKLWDAHMKAKKLLLENIEYNCNVNIPEDALIFGWFRRFTLYKQPEILTLDLERLERIVTNQERPVAFIFGGKAHPRDDGGKNMLKKLYQISQQDRFKDKLVLIPDYNWRMARYMVSGSDVWVNSPIRYQEACGTSGMKAAANGLIQFSTIDGWIDEIKDTGLVWEIAHNLDADQYYNQIEENIIPTFWDRDENGIPRKWLQRAKKTMEIALSQYGTDRMLRDYIEILYRPILKQLNQ
jgi:starch phosphorylase